MATISTTLLKKGAKFIDEDNPLYPMRFLKDKPISSLKGIDFIVLSNGEADKLITMEIKLPRTKSTFLQNEDTDEPEEYDTIEESLIQLYHKDLNDEVTVQWNIQRRKIVLEALRELLYPQFVKKLRLKLIEEAEDGIIEQCRRRFRYMIQQDKVTFSTMPLIVGVTITYA